MYNGSDLVLNVKSFNPDALETAISDTLQLVNAIRKQFQTRLYISVMGNQGGFSTLADVLFTGLFHNEYPIYTQQN